MRPISLMESISVSLSGSALVKSLVNQGHESPEDSPESPPSPGDAEQQPNVNTYETFMKKHLSNYGYYSNGEFKVLSKLYIVRERCLSAICVST